MTAPQQAANGAMLERAAAAFFAWPLSLPAYIAATLAAGGAWWRITTWLEDSSWWPWPYFIPQFTISYADNGFTRRALPGTIGDLLQIEPGVPAVQAFYIAGVLAGLSALLLFAWRTTRSLQPLQRVAVLGLVALSPALILHWMEDPGRLDAWVVCFAVLAALLASRRAYLTALAPAAPAGLTHESFFLTFGFLALAIADERRRQSEIGREELLRAGVAFALLGGLFGYLLLFGSADLASLQRSAAQLGQEVEIDGFNLYYSYLGFEARPHAWASCFIRNDPARIADLVLTLAFVAAQAFALFSWTDRRRQLIALLAVLGPLALSAVALDIGRYAAFASTALWLYFFIVVENERPALVLRAPMLALLAALTLLGPLGVTDGYQSLKGVLDAMFGAQSFDSLGPICNAALRG